MTIKQFIEKAIQGGWSDNHVSKNLILSIHSTNKKRNNTQVNVEYGDNIFLDPKAWQAVGKVEGWKPVLTMGMEYGGWKDKIKEMIDALTEGKTVEEFLGTL